MNILNSNTVQNKKKRPTLLTYSRVSTDKQTKDETIEIQIDHLNRYAEQNNYTIERHFTDNGISGAEINRPGLDKLLNYLNKSDTKTVLIYRLDRLARDILIQETIIRNLERRGIDLISIREGHLTKKDEQTILTRTMNGAISEYEKRTITRRLSEGRNKKAENGKYAGGGTPLGYSTNDKDLIIDEDELRTIKHIFYLYKRKKQSLNKISKHLNDKGYKTKRNGNWYASTINYIVNNKTYKGILNYKEITRERKDLSIGRTI